MSELEPARSQFLVYQDESGATRIDVRLDGKAAWLASAQVVDLAASSKANTGRHIKNVIDEGHLDAGRTVRDSRRVRGDRTHKDYLSVRRVPNQDSTNTLDTAASKGVESPVSSP